MNSPAQDASLPMQKRFSAAMKLHVAGKLGLAVEQYYTLLGEAPDNPEIHHALGAALSQLQKFDEAMDHLKRAHELSPGNIRYGTHYANALKQTNRADECMEVLKTMLEKDPKNNQVFTTFFNIGMEIEKFSEVEAVLRDMLSKRPDDMLLHTLMMLVLEKQDKHAEKVPHMDRMYKANPEQEEGFYIAYVKALRAAQRIGESEKIIQQGVERYPYSQELLALRAGMYHLRGEFEKSREAYQQALTLNPTNAKIRASLGLIKLLTTDLEEGYRDYSVRPNLDELGEKLTRLYPKWNGQDIPEDGQLILWTEQGVGDVIMFASLIPWLHTKCKNITCIVLEKMKPLMQRSFPDINFITSVQVISIGQHEAPEGHYHLPMGELMQHGLPHYVPFEHDAFLKADPKLVEKLREKYLKVAEKRGAEKLVGISWHTKNNDTSFMRNIPLAQWKPLLELGNIQYVSLQYGDHENEISAVNMEYNNAVYSDPDADAFGDMDQLAAMCCAMDEVVSIQNATVHLAGALGVPTTIMLTRASDWRWGLQPDRNKWYKSVTVERQEELLNWKPVLERVAKRLAKGK